MWGRGRRSGVGGGIDRIGCRVKVPYTVGGPAGGLCRGGNEDSLTTPGVVLVLRASRQGTLMADPAHPAAAVAGPEGLGKHARERTGEGDESEDEEVSARPVAMLSQGQWDGEHVTSITSITSLPPTKHKNTTRSGMHSAG